MLTDSEKQARARAIELELFAAGMDDAGNPETARRLRLAADDVQRLTDKLEAERSARRAIQERAERLQSILGSAVYQACKYLSEADRAIVDRIGDEVFNGSTASR